MVQAQNPQIAAVLPAVDRVLQIPAVQALGAQYGHTAVVHAIRSLFSEMRQAMLDAAVLPAEALQAPSLKRGRGEGTALKQLAAAFRALPIPVIGTISDGALKFDLRCLENEREFIDQLARLRLDGGGSAP